ncbi:MAG: WG repeat-containing protein [Clostridiales bacterium]|jgi:hypothetical protein|nr:WG repeat-containing protein [Clostridiales bacterium]
MSYFRPYKKFKSDYTPPYDKELLAKPVGELDISDALKKVLTDGFVKDLYGIVKKSEREICGVKFFNRKHLTELKGALARLNVEFRPDARDSADGGEAGGNLRAANNGMRNAANGRNSRGENGAQNGSNGNRSFGSAGGRNSRGENGAQNGLNDRRFGGANDRNSRGAGGRDPRGENRAQNGASDRSSRGLTDRNSSGENNRNPRGTNGKPPQKDARFQTAKPSEPIVKRTGPLTEADWTKYTRNGRWGYIDSSTNQIKIQPVYDEIFAFKEGVACAEKNEKFGYIDAENNVVIPFEYDLGMSFKEGLACVTKNNKTGYIARDGSVAIDFRFDAAMSFENGSARVKEGGKWMEIDKNGHTVKIY